MTTHGGPAKAGLSCMLHVEEVVEMRKYAIFAMVMWLLIGLQGIEYEGGFIPLGVTNAMWWWIGFGVLLGQILWPITDEQVQRFKATFTYYNSGEWPEEWDHADNTEDHDALI